MQVAGQQVARRGNGDGIEQVHDRAPVVAAVGNDMQEHFLARHHADELGMVPEFMVPVETREAFGMETEIKVGETVKTVHIGIMKVGEVVKVGPTQLGKPAGAWLVATIDADGDECCVIDRAFETRDPAASVLP